MVERTELSGELGWLLLGVVHHFLGVAGVLVTKEVITSILRLPPRLQQTPMVPSFEARRAG